jgi:gamma-glutamyltranspeptidase
MGGDGQVQIHLQLLARILLAREPVEEAIAAPRWTFDRTTLLAEPGLPALEPLPAGLSVLAMPVAELAGHAHAILAERGALEAASDPRADGVAVGD